MLLKEIMTEDVTIIEPTQTVNEVAKLMQKLDVESLPVCQNRKLTGLVI